MRRARTSGFTLVELMVTVAIVAILVAIGLPSFQSTLRSNRVATTTNELMASLALARSQAIRSPGGAWICTSVDGALCGGDSWDDGWIIWVDADENDANSQPTSEGDVVARYVQGRDKMEIVATALGGAEEANNIRFDRRGRTAGERTIAIQPEECSSGQELLRTLTLTPAGQTRVKKGSCT